MQFPLISGTPTCVLWRVREQREPPESVQESPQTWMECSPNLKGQEGFDQEDERVNAAKEASGMTIPRSIAPA